MIYELKQYGCDNCGQLSEILDIDQPLPKGWKYVDGCRFTVYCDKCAKQLKIK